MAAYKYTALFEYLSGRPGEGVQRKAGFSESIYWTGFGVDTENSFRNTYLPARALLLPDNCQVIGYRIQAVDPSGAAQSRALVINNSSVLGGVQSADIPQMAALIRLRSSDRNNVRSMRLAAIPDDQVKFGEFSPSIVYKAKLQIYLTRLATWRFRGQDLTAARFSVKSIDALGVVTMNADILLAPGDFVNLTNIQLADGSLFSTRVKVDTFTNSKLWSIKDWGRGIATSGYARKVTYVYPAIVLDIDPAVRMVTRKVGRPFTGYRGRRSARRRKVRAA